MVGTIEPRKNLLQLLTVWHRWTQEGRSPRARLIVVGRRGWENENILELLDRSKGLAPSVIEVASLGDARMVALLKGATALLAPSFVEGYGLPIAEALALGTPVIASDTDAHREAGGAFADYLDPLDGSSAGCRLSMIICMRTRRAGRSGSSDYPELQTGELEQPPVKN